MFRTNRIAAALTLLAALVGSGAVAPDRAAADDLDGCYTVPCTHSEIRPCTHMIAFSVPCCCHPWGYHIEWRPMHIVDMVTPHAFDWVCTCGHHQHGKHHHNHD